MTSTSDLSRAARGATNQRRFRFLTLANVVFERLLHATALSPFDQQVHHQA